MVTVYNTHPTETVSEVELRRLVDALLREETRITAEISIILCDRARHVELHRKYLGHNHPTDVLAFPLGDAEPIEGEVYVDLDTARDRHNEFSCEFEVEVARYVIHGVLHLLGFDDKDPEKTAEMKNREEKYVALFEEQQS